MISLKKINQGHAFYLRNSLRTFAASNDDKGASWKDAIYEPPRADSNVAKGRVTKNPTGYNRQKSPFFTSADYNPAFRKQIEQQHMIKSDKEYKFAIVGTGPAGFYMAKNLLKHVGKCRVDLIDRNPHPFGLIRTGVAPDHQAMKRIENDFSQVLANENCDFYGNVWVGSQQGEDE